MGYLETSLNTAPLGFCQGSRATSLITPGLWMMPQPRASLGGLGHRPPWQPAESWVPQNGSVVTATTKAGAGETLHTEVTLLSGTRLWPA